MDGWMYVLMDGWIDERLDGKMDGLFRLMDGWRNEWMDRMQADKQTKGRIDRCIIGGIDRQIE